MKPKSEPIHTLDELGTLYLLHPEFRDVVVEGHTDQEFYQWYFDEHSVSGVKTYAVDEFVGVDSQKVYACGQEVGPRGRLVALAVEVERWNLAENTFTAIVDLDRGCIEGYSVLVELSSLITTDVGSLEVYFFQERPLRKLLSLVLVDSHGAVNLIALMTPVLNLLFLVRCVLHIDGPDVALVKDFLACIKSRRASDGTEVLELDHGELLRRSLDQHKKGARLGELTSLVDQLLQKLPEDKMRAISGHDIAPLLIKLLGLKNQ